MTILQRLSAGISWFLAGIGGLVSLVVCFAAGMKSAPRMEYIDVVVSLPLPLIGGTIAWLVLTSCRRRQTTRRCLLWTLPPISIAGLSLLYVLVHCLWSYSIS